MENFEKILLELKIKDNTNDSSLLERYNNFLVEHELEVNSQSFYDFLSWTKYCICDHCNSLEHENHFTWIGYEDLSEALEEKILEENKDVDSLCSDCVSEFKEKYKTILL